MTTTHDHPSTSATTTSYLRAWPDDVVARLGWPVHSAYTECCVTTVLGPTSTLLLRQLVFELLTGGAQGPHPVNLEEIGRSLGLGAGTSPNSKLGRALTRLGQFGYLKPIGAALPGYWVRTHVAPLSERQLTRGGRRVRQLHEQFHGSEDVSLTP
jgi:hypothetical protein